jgi:uncharacterized membrane protein
VKVFLKATIGGGVLFLLPVAFMLFVLSYAFRLVKRVAAHIAHILHLDHSGDMVGVGATTALSILILVLVSFTAGIIARTSIGTRISRWSERAFLTGFPQY